MRNILAAVIAVACVSTAALADGRRAAGANDTAYFGQVIDSFARAGLATEMTTMAGDSYADNVMASFERASMPVPQTHAGLDSVNHYGDLVVASFVRAGMLDGAKDLSPKQMVLAGCK